MSKPVIANPWPFVCFVYFVVATASSNLRYFGVRPLAVLAELGPAPRLLLEAGARRSANLDADRAIVRAGLGQGAIAPAMA